MLLVASTSITISATTTSPTPVLAWHGSSSYTASAASCGLLGLRSLVASGSCSFLSALSTSGKSSLVLLQIGLWFLLLVSLAVCALLVAQLRLVVSTCMTIASYEV